MAEVDDSEWGPSDPDGFCLADCFCSRLACQERFLNSITLADPCIKKQPRQGLHEVVPGSLHHH
eukprot:4294210-Karenia_brevis.AAC.1